MNNVIFKVKLSPSKKISVIHLIESPLKMMKNAFCFIWIAFFVLKIFKFFVTTFCSCGKNGSIRKIRLTTNLIMRQPDLQTTVIHILPNISHSKDNKTVKFGQLTEYNKENIFLQTLCEKWGRKTSSRPLLIF